MESSQQKSLQLAAQRKKSRTQSKTLRLPSTIIPLAAPSPAESTPTASDTQHLMKDSEPAYSAKTHKITVAIQRVEGTEGNIMTSEVMEATTTASETPEKSAAAKVKSIPSTGTVTAVGTSKMTVSEISEATKSTTDAEVDVAAHAPSPETVTTMTTPTANIGQASKKSVAANTAPPASVVKLINLGQSIFRESTTTRAKKTVTAAGGIAPKATKASTSIPLTPPTGINTTAQSTATPGVSSNAQSPPSGKRSPVCSVVSTPTSTTHSPRPAVTKPPKTPNSRRLSRTIKPVADAAETSSNKGHVSSSDSEEGPNKIEKIRVDVKATLEAEKKKREKKEKRRMKKAKHRQKKMEENESAVAGTHDVRVDAIGDIESLKEVKTVKIKLQHLQASVVAQMTETLREKVVSDENFLTSWRCRMFLDELRLATNHPLFMRRIYTEQSIVQLIERLNNKPELKGKLTLPETMKEDMLKMTDFHIYLACKGLGEKEGKVRKSDLCESDKLIHIERLLNDVTAMGSKVVIISQFECVLHLLDDWLRKKERRLVIDLLEFDHEKTSLLWKFETTASIKILLLHSEIAMEMTREMSCDIDLVILYDIDPRPHKHNQALRFLQNSKQIVQLIAERYVDEAILDVRSQLETDPLYKNKDQVFAPMFQDIKIAGTILKTLLQYNG